MSRYNIFDRLFRREATPPPGTISTTTPDKHDEHPVKSGNWQANVVTPYGTKSLLVPTWYRCVTLIMQTMGQMLMQYTRFRPDGQNFFVDNYGYGRRLNYLLQVRPNPMMTASMMQEQIEFKKIYYGNAYVYIERDLLGDVVALWLCQQGTFLPDYNAYNIMYKSNLGNVFKNNVPASDILHFRNVILDYDMMRGQPVIAYAMRALQIAATGDDQALQDMAKGGKYKVLIQEEKSVPLGTRGRANKNELRRMTDQFADEWMSGDVVMLDNVADAKIMSQTAQQLQLLEQRGYSDEALCRMMGIPKIMAMIGEGGSYTIPKNATQEFLQRTIQPRIREMEDEINSKILTIEDFGKRQVHICEKALLRLDAEGQADIDLKHLQSGWSVNEIRRHHDLPAIPEGDAHYISTNLAEVGSEKLRSVSSDTKPATTQQPTNGGEDTGEGAEA